MSKLAFQGGVPANYLLGRGRLYLLGERGKTDSLGALLADTAAWRDIGNVTQMTVNFESETKDHVDYQTGVQNIDKSISVSNKMTISFATDEQSVLNLSNFFGGTVFATGLGAAVLNPAKLASDNAVFAGVENMYFELPAGNTAVLYDVWYDLQMVMPGTPVLGFEAYASKTVKAYDFEAQASQAISVRKGATTRTAADGTPLTEGTHYVLDRKAGMIKFLQAALFNTTTPTMVQIKWAAGTSGLAGVDTSLFSFGLLQHSGKTVSLKFVQENPNDDNKINIFIVHQIKLKPEGEFAGISDDWSSVSFSGVAEAYSGEVPVGSSPYGMFVTRDAYST